MRTLRVSLLIFTFIVSALASRPVWAQSPTNEELKRELDRKDQQIRQLLERLERVERLVGARPDKPEAPPAVVAPPAAAQAGEAADKEKEAKRVVDLKGRTVLPGFAATHDHPDQWDLLNPLIVPKVVTDDIHIERFINVPPGEVMQTFPRVLDEAVRKAKPGQWIRISILYGREYKWGDEISDMLGKQINKDMLNMTAPNNPVLVRGGFTGLVFNQKALDALKAYYGSEWAKFPADSNPLSAGVGDREPEVVKNGACGVCYRYFEMDVLYKTPDLAEIYRQGLSWLAGYGQTLNASNMYTAGSLAAYSRLDNRNEIPIRFAWTWYWPPRKDLFLDKFFSTALAAFVGKGTDYFWFIGGNPVSNLGSCSTLPGTSPEVKEREMRGKCIFNPTSPEGPANREILGSWVRAGGRFAGDHTGGDADIDYMMDVIEQSSKNAGMTMDDIRNKRHSYDHMTMSPRPDQIPRIKDLGMMVSGTDLRHWEGGTESAYKNYGEQAVDWVVPRRNLLASGVMNSVEIDRPIGYTNLTYFTVMYTGITRKDMNGKVWGPNQTIGREAMLKSSTLHGANYAMKEKKTGSLEVGKWADLIILDRDYLTIPIDDIPNIRVLMTMVGGQVAHMVPSFAREVGMQPKGSQVELGADASKW